MIGLPHPIQYQGSKRNLAHVILRYFPNNVKTLIEPFAGSAAISVAVAANNLAEKFLINDINKPLSELLRLIVEEPEQLANFYAELWNDQFSNSIQHYYRVRDDFNRTKDPRLFLYLLTRCVKASVRYNSEGMFNQSPDKRRHGTKPAKMRDNIFGVSELLRNKAKFSSLDYKDVLKNATPYDLVYMDPPYQGVCGNRDSRYYSGICYQELIQVLEQLNANDIPYILSYDGRRGDKIFGEYLPDNLSLTRIEIEAGVSTQSTLLGFKETTYESLYISQSLIRIISHKPINYVYTKTLQPILFEDNTNYAETTKRIY